jgi:hypothetical protein
LKPKISLIFEERSVFQNFEIFKEFYKQTAEEDQKIAAIRIGPWAKVFREEQKQNCSKH